jgi:hypothetical protein
MFTTKKDKYKEFFGGFAYRHSLEDLSTVDIFKRDCKNEFIFISVTNNDDEHRDPDIVLEVRRILKT